MNRSAIRAPVVAVVLGLMMPNAVEAQQRDERTDSTEVILRRLMQRLDSLERVIRQLRTQHRGAEAETNELDALRAAARAAAGQGAAPAPSGEGQGSRTGNLQSLNPEISVTGDVVGNFISPAGGPSRFSGVPREFEFSFQAALDPYTRTKVFVTREEDFEIAGFAEEGEEEEEGSGFEIEEGYMYWVGLPGGFGAKVGKFRQEIGLYNRWHTHALFEVERPLVATRFLGEDGLIQTGAAVTLPSFTVGPTTQTLTLEVTRGNNEALFDGGNQLSYLGRFQNFWDLSASTYLQLGATGVWGQNDDAGLESRLLALDFSFRWTPPARARYRDFQLKGEWYFAERNAPDIAAGPLPVTIDGRGGYLQANARVSRRLILGARADFVEPLGEDQEVIQ
ncbi:MAG: hypothetical protein ACE5FJ_09115, partial [Gemmatimonadales bacterium]